MNSQNKSFIGITICALALFFSATLTSFAVEPNFILSAQEANGKAISYEEINASKAIKNEAQDVINEFIARHEPDAAGTFIYDRYDNLEAKVQNIQVLDIKNTEDLKKSSGYEISLNTDDNSEMKTTEILYFEDDMLNGRLVEAENNDRERFASFNGTETGIIVVADVLYSTAADTSEIAAHTKIRELMNGYPAVDWYLKDYMYDSIEEPYDYNSSQKDELHNVALRAITGCNTDYEKIEAVCRFVAENIYYDRMFYDGFKDWTYRDPYAIWKNKITVCSGYSALCKTLLIDLGIPCMKIEGDNHAYNAAYDRQQNRWIFFDSTWYSGNEYTDDGNMIKGDCDGKYFDMSDEYMSSLNNHEIWSNLFLTTEKKDVLYYLTISEKTSNWVNQNKWVLEANEPIDPKCKSIRIRGVLCGIPVDSINECAFDMCKSLEKAVIGEGVTKIETRAFAQCNNLKSITIPPGMKEIGDSAFYDCRNLKSIVLPEGLIEIGEYAFCDCKNLKSIKIPDSVSKIGEAALSDCKSLKKITIPKGMTRISNYTFMDCKNLKSIALPESIGKIGKRAFMDCYKLKDVYYTGSKRQWKLIKISGGNGPIKKVKIHYNSGK